MYMICYVVFVNYATRHVHAFSRRSSVSVPLWHTDAGMRREIARYFSIFGFFAVVYAHLLELGSDPFTVALNLMYDSSEIGMLNRCIF